MISQRKRRKRKKKKLREGNSILNSSSSECSNTSRKADPSFGASGNLERKITSQARVKSTGCMMVQGRIEEVLADWKIDTGAKSSFITKETFDLIVDKPVLRPVINNYVTANGQRLQCIGQASMPVMFAEHVFEHDIIVGGVKCNLIGEDFTTMYRCVGS